MSVTITDYGYRSDDATWDNGYLVNPALRLLLTALAPPATVFELGCGNGHFSGLTQATGYRVTAVDPSSSGVAQAQARHPDGIFAEARVEDDLPGRFGRFSAVVSLEVIEHCYSAQVFARQLHALLQPGGTAIVSTPYHGYWKYLALALSGRLGRHMDPLWEGGHIKFFTEVHLRRLFAASGFEDIRTYRAGRWLPAFAKSIIVVARRPPSQ